MRGLNLARGPLVLVGGGGGGRKATPRNQGGFDEEGLRHRVPKKRIEKGSI